MNLNELDKAICGEIWTSDETWRNVLYLCDGCGQRFVGSRGYKKAADYVAQKFAEYGLEEVALEPFEARGWERGPAEIVLLGQETQTVPCIALPYCPPCEIELELFDLGTGTPEEIERHKERIPGKAVLVSSGMPPMDRRYIHRMEKYMRALEAGAKAFLFVNHEAGDMVITGGLPVKGADIPGVGLSYEHGQMLSRLLEAKPLTIRLKVEGVSKPVISWNVVGELPGSDLDNEIIVVGGHLDSHDLCAGATDNASGIALLLEAARVLGQLKGRLSRTVRFIAFGVEELGLIGSGAYVEAHAGEMEKVQFMLNLDMTGANVANALALQGCPELVPYFGALSQQMAYKLFVAPRFHPYSDHFAFVMAGVPAGSLGYFGEDRKGYAHSPADTVDKLSPFELQASAMVTARVLLRLAQDRDWKPVHKSAEEVRALLEKSPFADALRYEGRWPWA